MDYSVSDDEFDVNISVPVSDEEATLTLEEDLYLSASEESVTAESRTQGNSPQCSEISVTPTSKQSYNQASQKDRTQNSAKVPPVDNAEQPFDDLPVPTTP